MAQGKIRMWNADRGYGFIQPDNGGPDVFVHATAFEKAELDAPDVGDQFTYEVEPARNGKLAAVNLKAA